jgi:SPP1 gp7 family putative phage head morphogenesis protein
MAELDVGYAIGLEPAGAVAYLRSMGVAVAGNWQEAAAAARQHAIAISGVTQLGVVGDVQAGLVRALAKGQTPEQFIADLEPKLKAAGWWGKDARAGKGRVDPATGEIAPDGKGLTHSRLRFIYREHTANAYAAAKEAWAVENGATRWQYSAILDSRTRPAHRAMHGRIFRMDDGAAGAFKPRNGFGCRCTCIYYFDAPRQVPPTPAAQTRTSEVPGPGGVVHEVQELVDDKLPGGAFRPDVGFDLPPGADWRKALTSYALDKAGDLPPQLGALAAYRHLQRPGVLQETVQAWQAFARPMVPASAADVIKPRGDVFYVGALFPDVVAALQAREVLLKTAVVSVVDAKVAHSFRTAKAAPLPLDWFMDLPRHLFDGPSLVTLDKGRLVLWFDLPGQAGKLVVSVNQSVKVAGSKRLENVLETGVAMDAPSAADAIAKAVTVWRR